MVIYINYSRGLLPAKSWKNKYFVECMHAFTHDVFPPQKCITQYCRQCWSDVLPLWCILEAVDTTERSFSVNWENE